MGGISERNDIPYWGRELGRRVGGLEALRPDVVAERVDVMSKEVDALKRAFYTFAISAVGSAIVFAFTVFALLGHH